MTIGLAKRRENQVQDDPFMNGIFSKNSKGDKKEQSPQKNKYKKLYLLFVATLVIFYPFVIVGTILLIVAQIIDKKDQREHVYDFDYQSFIKSKNNLFIGLSVLTALLNLFLFILVIPRGYFSCYLLFPLNNFNTTLTFGAHSILAILAGGIGIGCTLIAFSGFVEKRKVVSKEDKQLEIINSKEYKKRLENKFEESQNFVEEYEKKYEIAIVIKDVALRDKRLYELSRVILLGTDEYGLSYEMSFDELNQHALIPATTGAGKTTAIQIFMEHAIKFGIPVLLIDGKGAKDTLDAARDIASKYDKEVRAFTDDGDMRYNPIKYGNDISIRDKLSKLAETESIFYTGASKALLQVTVQLLDEFSKTHDIERSLPFVQKYLMPKNVLELFSDRLSERDPDFFKVEIKVDSPPSKAKGKEKTNSNDKQETPKGSKGSSKFSKFEQTEAKVENTKTIILDPEKLSLDGYYQLIKEHSKIMNDEEKTLFERLFVRYEHKESPFYLYDTSEALQTNINMLLDSELGNLFDTKGSNNNLDLSEIANNGDVVYVSLNGLIYKEFIKTLAQMIIGDINSYAADLYAKNQRKEFLVIFDEPASYLNESFIDTVNKGRGAGIHAIYAPQTMADIEKLGDKLKEQLVGNVNTFIIGKTNEKDEVAYWSETLGTYADIDVTDVVTQEEGFADVGNMDWKGEKGTKRKVDRFKFHPNRIRDLRRGEFVVYRTAKDIHEPPRAVYFRNPLESKSMKAKRNEKK